MIRHPLFDVLVDDVFYIVADVRPYVVFYVVFCVGADVGAYVVVLYVVSYVSPRHLPDGRASIQIIKASGASEHVGFLPR